MSESSDAPVETTGGGRKKGLFMAVVLAGGLAVGSGAGGFFVGPLLAGPDANTAATAAEAGAADAGAVRSSRRESAPILYVAENLVLNPAESGGTRFLMASAAFEVRDTRLLEQLRGREIELKDTLLDVLGGRTVEQLADITQRETLKEEIRSAVDAMFGAGSVQRVYLPQFVIQ